MHSADLRDKNFQPPWIAWEVLHKVLPDLEVKKLGNRFPTAFSIHATDPDDIQRQKFLVDYLSLIISTRLRHPSSNDA
jgi:hypothetical protein